jgi:hypothetical protein
MSVGNKALNGEWEEILAAYKFEITEDMTMSFQGRSCHIEDNKKKLVETLGRDDGEVMREVFAGYRCYVMKAWIKFEKKSL